MTKRLLLFDIDGTLLRPAGLGRRSLELAFSERFRCADVFGGVTFHGRTDPDILQQGLDRIGASHDHLPDILAAYLSHLENEVARAGDLLLPGVRAVLEALGARADVVLGLVTGNVAEGARIKLEPFGILRFFSIGAYGGEARDRTGILRLAKARAEHRVDASFPRAFHVGDTGADIVAAREGGVSSVAVATGGEDRDTLESYRPDHLFESLDPPDPFLDLVLA